MKVLVVGGGGREHALCWSVKRDVPDAELFAAPGNPGTAGLATNLPIGATAVDELVAAAARHAFNLVIIGPEAPLAAGLADRLRAMPRPRPVFGPGAAAARLESSKAFAKEVMFRADVPTAASAVFTAPAAALDYIRGRPAPLVVKASGLAAGKGAVVCATRHEAEDTARALLGGALGDAGREIVVEEFLEGEELSVLALTDGEQITVLPPAQDHKRIGEGDTGPNTGGMGAYCPVGLATPELLARVRRDVFEPVLREMARRGTPYQGVLYAGLMLGASGVPYVLEFNCRFGDPEAQAILPALHPGITGVLFAIATRSWGGGGPVIDRAQRAAVTTVLAARGYPENPEKGAPIAVPADLGDDVLVFHAGTTRDADGTLRTAGGRVLNVTGLAADVPAAARVSSAACERIAFSGKTWRRDIAWRETQRTRAGAS